MSAGGFIDSHTSYAYVNDSAQIYSTKKGYAGDNDLDYGGNGGGGTGNGDRYHVTFGTATTKRRKLPACKYNTLGSNRGGGGVVGNHGSGGEDYRSVNMGMSMGMGMANDSYYHGSVPALVPDDDCYSKKGTTKSDSGKSSESIDV